VRYEWDRVARAGAAFEWGRRWSTVYAAVRYARALAAVALGLAVVVGLVAAGVWLHGRVPGVVIALAGAGLCLVLGVGRLATLFYGRYSRGAERVAWLLVLAGLVLVGVAAWLS